MITAGYPVILPGNTRTGNFIFNGLSLNANYDITWSFEVKLNSNYGANVGFTTFLTTQSTLTGGNVGVDLGYSGTSSLYTDSNSYNVATSSLSSTVHAGIQGAALGIGFDNTGYFALSCSINTILTRDGIALESLNGNETLTIRGGVPNYNLLSNDYIASLSPNFDPFSIDNFVKIRCRLGNVGRTLYVDYKPDSALDYINLKTLTVSLSVTDNTKYYVGISYSSPVSSVDANSVGALQIKNFHVEGRYDANPSYAVIGANLVSGEGITTTSYNLVTEVNTLSTVVPPTSGVQDVNLEHNTEGTDDSVIYVPV